MKCECRIEQVDADDYIVRCPLHEAAPELLEACMLVDDIAGKLHDKNPLIYYEITNAVIGQMLQSVRVAIAKAENR